MYEYSKGNAWGLGAQRCLGVFWILESSFREKAYYFPLWSFSNRFFARRSSWKILAHNIQGLLGGKKPRKCSNGRFVLKSTNMRKCLRGISSNSTIIVIFWLKCKYLKIHCFYRYLMIYVLPCTKCKYCSCWYNSTDHGHAYIFECNDYWSIFILE